MSSPIQSVDQRQPWLFTGEQMPERSPVSMEPEMRPIQAPVWTDNKARLIMHYLHYFVLLTKHGTYIDGFAGPQSETENESWAAKLVLSSEPRWIRHIHLCDEKTAQIERLKGLRDGQPQLDQKGRKLNRKIHLYHGDFNEKVDEILGAGSISEKEATFCLLDQRTFECRWGTIRKLASYKKTGNKIEVSTFLQTTGWRGRWRLRRILMFWRVGGDKTTGPNSAKCHETVVGMPSWIA